MCWHVYAVIVTANNTRVLPVFIHSVYCVSVVSDEWLKRVHDKSPCCAVCVSWRIVCYIDTPASLNSATRLRNQIAASSYLPHATYAIALAKHLLAYDLSMINLLVMM